MEEERKQTYIIALILVLVALISFFGLSKMYSNPDTFAKTVHVLDEEKNKNKFTTAIIICLVITVAALLVKIFIH